MAIRVAVLIPDGTSTEAERREWQAEALEHCRRRGYQVVGFAGTWRDAAFLVLGGEADVIVAARDEHFPVDRVPRVETPETAPRDPDALPRQRRARVDRRE